jgi:hypothetical protein
VGKIESVDPVVEAGIIGAGAAVISSFLTGLLLINSTRIQIRSAAEVARRTFISEKQADAYVNVCNQVSRVEAWANVASKTALGQQSHLERPETMAADDWFDLQGRLRVFGSRIVRDEFDMVMGAAHALQILETSALQGHSTFAIMHLRKSRGYVASEKDVTQIVAAIRLHAARVRTAVSAEVGPLYDLLDRRPVRWWQIRRRLDVHKVLTQSQDTGSASQPPSA